MKIPPALLSPAFNLGSVSAPPAPAQAGGQTKQVDVRPAAASLQQNAAQRPQLPLEQGNPSTGTPDQPSGDIPRGSRLNIVV